MSKKLHMALVGSAIGLAAMPSVASAADATTNAAVRATVVAPITITKAVDLNFGSFAADDLTTGTVVISTGGARSFTGGASRVTSGNGTVTAASFDVTGAGNSTFSISLPTSVTLTRDGGSETMSVASFLSNPASPGALVDGAATVAVGATLSVAAAQVVGLYENADGLAVTVAYN